MISRRKLIKQSLLSALAPGVVSMPTLLASTRETEVKDPHFIVFVQIYGAWDVCLAFDPKDRDLLLSDARQAFDQPYSMQQVKQFGPHLLAPDGFALGGFADRLTVINGIDMELDGGHTPQIVMSGDLQALSQAKPSIQAILSERHPYARARLIPHLYGSYDGFFLPGPFGSKTIVISADDAFRVLSGSRKFDTLSDISASTRSMAALYSGLDRQRLGQYVKAVDQALELRLRLNQGNVPLEIPSNGQSLGSFIGTLFKREVLGAFTWSLGETFGFDTHSDHYAQHPLKAALGEIAALCTQLQTIPWNENSSIFDHTTVVVAAEFSRSPRLNSSAGKDHNFRSNSLLLIGKNVQGARFGQSGEFPIAGFPLEGHVGLPIDYKTGRYSRDGDRLFMRNIWAGCSDILGVDLKSEFGPNTRAIQFLNRV
ncbi:MAG: DUF1501 domain-containing protein [Proteobacteria bacterium]|nr:DUF1501 domain-containing protein [Pseudomonadota bacterium]